METMKTSMVSKLPKKDLNDMKDEQVKQHILDTVRQFFFTYGSDGISMSKLAQEMKMSKKTIYKHFKFKEDLIICIIDDLRNKLKIELEQIMNNPDIPAMDKIKLLVRKKVDIISQVKPPFMKDINRSGDVKRSVEQIEEMLIPSCLIVMKEGQEQGVVRKDMNLEFFLEVVNAAIDKFLNFDALKRFSISPDRAMEMVFDICLNGILVKEEESG